MGEHNLSYLLYILTYLLDTPVHNATVGLSSRLCGCSNTVVNIVLHFADKQNV